MIDPILSLAFSMHTNKGVYALLLGSGISRAAGIPTGWEVTLDLIRKLAHLKGENCEPDPAKWYEGTFSEEADYSKLLRVVSKTSSERNKLLRAYFEPTDDERQHSIKTPTEAHKAIARLVAKGYIKVILTTNFDRLMEKTLEEAGVIPTVISTVDAIHGATPIMHSACTLIKLHGDYLDSRIKNTPEELSTYDKRLNSLLDRVLDEFGLIICGWSGDWDVALRAAIKRCKSRRFTTYWTVKYNISDAAKEIIEFRTAEIIRISSADAFFTELEEKVNALEEYDQPNPLSAKVAAITTKKYLEDEKYKIRLHDLIVQETEKLHNNLLSDYSSSNNRDYSKEALYHKVQKYEAYTEVVQAIMTVCAYWPNHNVEKTLIRCLERMTDLQQEGNGLTVWINLLMYPSLMLFYSIGIVAMAAENYKLVHEIIVRPENKYKYPNRRPLFLSLSPETVIEDTVAHQLPGLDRRYTPIRDHLFEILESPVKEFVTEKLEYEMMFDRFEYCLSLEYMDYMITNGHAAVAPIGRFGWHNRYFSHQHISFIISEEIGRDGAEWPLLKAGLCDKSLARLLDVKKNLDEAINRTPWH